MSKRKKGVSKKKKRFPVYTVKEKWSFWRLSPWKEDGGPEAPFFFRELQICGRKAKPHRKELHLQKYPRTWGQGLNLCGSWRVKREFLLLCFGQKNNIPEITLLLHPDYINQIISAVRHMYAATIVFAKKKKKNLCQPSLTFLGFK